MNRGDSRLDQNTCLVTTTIIFITGVTELSSPQPPITMISPLMLLEKPKGHMSDSKRIYRNRIYPPAWVVIFALLRMRGMFEKRSLWQLKKSIFAQTRAD
jgi:hypothetical protein